MSIIQPDSIKAIAHSIDLPRLSDEAAKTLAPDVEYRLREVVQEALKFAKHAKRTKLTTEDINNALRLKNVEPVYGFNSRDPAKFLRVAPNSELMYVQDPEVSFNQLIETALPKLPRIPGVTAHWLAINGVQPDLPENTSAGAPPKKRRPLLGLPGQGSRLGGLQEAAAAAAAAAVAGLDPTGHHAGLPGAADAAGAATAVGGVLRLGGSAAQQQQQLLLSGAPAGVGVTPRSAATAAVQLQLPLRHAVSRELQVYFDRVMGLILAPPSPADATSTTTVSPFAPAAGGGSMVGAQPGAAGAAAPGADSKQSSLLAGVLASVGADPGLHPLVPYFCKSIADGVVQYLGNLGVLHRFLALTRALLANPDVHLAPYLQQLLPAVVTCVVTKTLGSSAAEDHWSVRREAAALLATITRKFAAPHHNLQPRLCRVLSQALLDADKPLTSKYGAVVGLQALGPQVVRQLLIPHLEPFMSAVLIPAMCDTPGQDDADAAAAAAGQGSSLQQQHRVSLQRQLQQQQQEDAWWVYDALVSAVGGAMYDLLIGYMRGRMPVQLVLPRPGAGAPGGSSSTWQQEYTQILMAAKRQAAQHGRQQQQQHPGALQRQVHQQQQRAVGSKAGLQGPPALMRAAAGHPATASAGDGRDGGGDSLSLAEVLGQSWKEDSDVNATLGALLSLFGDDLLPNLPLPQLAAVSL